MPLLLLSALEDNKWTVERKAFRKKLRKEFVLFFLSLGCLAIEVFFQPAGTKLL